MITKLFRAILARPFTTTFLGLFLSCSISVVFTWRRALGFCEDAKGQEKVAFEQRARDAGFEVFPFKSNDGVSLVARPLLFPLNPFHCDARYASGHVASTIFFAD